MSADCGLRLHALGMLLLRSPCFAAVLGSPHMLTAKSITRAALPGARGDAERYRLLNEPGGAESICLDALAVDTHHEAALVTPRLAIPDQFDDDTAANVRRAREVLPRLRDGYKRAYYAGVLDER